MSLISTSVLRAHGLRLDARASAGLFPSRNPTCVATTRRGRRVFVKAAVRGDPGVDVERAALVALRSAGAAVPEVVISEPGFVAMEWMDGATLYSLRRRRGHGALVDEAVGKALGQVQRSLRAGVPADFATRALWTSPEVFASASPAMLKLIRDVQADAAAQERLSWLLSSERHVARAAVHGDCRQPNVLVRGRRVVFVDWEASGAGDPCRDVGMLLADDYRCWLAPESRRERQTEAMRDAHFEALLAGWESEWGPGHRERVWCWLAESLLRHEFARAHHLHVVNEAVVRAALRWLREVPR